MWYLEQNEYWYTASYDTNNDSKNSDEAVKVTEKHEMHIVTAWQLRRHP